MGRPQVRDWTVWIALSVPLCAYLMPAAFGESGSVLFLLLMWWVVRLESLARGFATQDEVIAVVLREKRKELEKIPVGLLGVPYHRMGKFLFPKRLSNLWTLCVFMGAVGGLLPVASAFFETGELKPGAYSFGMLAEIWTAAIVQMAFWVRFNLTFRNWKTPRALFDDICEKAEVGGEKKSEAWKKCFEADLVVEN